MVLEERLAVQAVTQIAVEAVREASPNLKVAGVMRGLGGTNYIEILITVDGWSTSQITVGAFRNAGAAALKRQIVESLQRRLDEPGN